MTAKLRNRRIAQLAVVHVLHGTHRGHKKKIKAPNWDKYRRSATSWELTRNPAHKTALDKCLYDKLRPAAVPLARGTADKLSVIRDFARRARQMGCGNCFEMAAAAFDYAYTMAARPLDLMGLKGADHTFVCIGRLRGSNLADPRTWGEACFICDPWAKGFKPAWRVGFYPAKDFNLTMRRVVRFVRPYLRYRVD